MIKTKVLGTDFIVELHDLNDRDMADKDGYCQLFDKKIVLREPKYMGGSSENSNRLQFEHVLRHELIHAISVESGTRYDDNEDLVDWIASIMPKMDSYNDIMSQLEIREWI